MNASFQIQARIEKRALAGAALDGAFGSAGVVTIAPTTDPWVATELLVQGASLYVLAFRAVTWTAEVRLEKRDATTGALDPGFGTGGVITFNDFAGRLSSDGTALFVAGSSGASGSLAAFVERRSLSTGALIGSFGTGGRMLSDPGTADDRYAALVTDGSSLWLAGTFDALSSSAASGTARLEKRDAGTGALDPGFGSGGVVLGPAGSFNRLLLSGADLYASAQDYDGGPTSAVSLHKFAASSGALDAGWASSGVFLHDPTAQEEQPGEIVDAGAGAVYAVVVLTRDGTDTATQVIKLNAVGALDGSFAAGGVHLQDDSANSDLYLELFLDGSSLYLSGTEMLGGLDTRWRVEQIMTGAGPTHTGTPSVSPTASATPEVSATPQLTATPTRTPSFFTSPTPTSTPGGCSVFGETTTLSFTSSGSSYLWFTQQALAAPLTARSVSVYNAGSASELRVAIYSDSGSNAVGTLLAQSGSVPAAPGWNAVSIPDTALAAGNYWLAFQTTAGFSFRFGPSATNQYASYVQSYGAFPASVSPSYGPYEFAVSASDCPGPVYSPTVTPSNTALVTATRTRTVSPTFSVSPTRSATRTITSTHSLSPTFSVSPTPVPNSIPEAVDNLALTFTLGGNANWYNQSVTTYSGGDAARSGAIGDSQSSWMETVINGPGSLSFYWSVSSELNWDYLRVSVNGVDQGGAISGTVAWAQRTLALGAGTSTVRWTYIKDGSLSAGSDAGYVDLVVFTPAGSPTISPTFSVSPTITPTRTITATFSISPTHSISPTWSATFTISPTFSVSPTRTVSRTVSATRSATRTRTPTITRTRTPGPAGPTVLLPLWTTNGHVHSITRTATTLYVAGAFTSITSPDGTTTLARNRLAAFDINTLQPLSWDPNADGLVYTLAQGPDGLYAGGSFFNMGGQVRTRLAKLDYSTGAVLAWAPTAAISGSGAVLDIAVAQGGTKIYIAGNFNMLNGALRWGLGAVDGNGALLPFDPNPSASPRTLALDGTRVFVGGIFSSIAGQARTGLAAFNIASDALEPFNPVITGTFTSTVNVEVLGGRLLVTGNITHVNGSPRNGLAAFDLPGLGLSAWAPNAGPVATISAQDLDTRYFAGGGFNEWGGVYGNYHLGEANTSSGTVTSWGPDPNAEVRALSTWGDTVFVGGMFTTILGQTRPHLAAIYDGPAFTPTRTATISPTNSVSPTISATFTVSPTPSISPTPTASPTFTPTPERAPARPGQLFSYPNPFIVSAGRSVNVVFEPSSRASLEVWDWSGRRRGSLDPGAIHASEGYATWDGRLDGGDLAPPGVYFMLLRSEHGTVTSKLTVLWP